jgi:hypothetical protein
VRTWLLLSDQNIAFLCKSAGDDDDGGAGVTSLFGIFVEFKRFFPIFHV